MSAFQNDDTYNVLAEHWIETFQADPKLGVGGDLAIKTWEREEREDAGVYNSNELPACSVSVSNTGSEQIKLSKWHQSTFIASIMIYTAGAKVQIVSEETKRYGGRFEHVARQQTRPDKQISAVTDDLLGAVPKSVEIVDLGTASGADKVGKNNSLRGVFAIIVRFTVNFITPRD